MTPIEALTKIDAALEMLRVEYAILRDGITNQSEMTDEDREEVERYDTIVADAEAAYSVLSEYLYAT